MYDTYITYNTDKRGESYLDDDDIIWHKCLKEYKKEFKAIMKKAEKGDIPQLKQDTGKMGSVVYYNRNIPRIGETRTEFSVVNS